MITTKELKIFGKMGLTIQEIIALNLLYRNSYEKEKKNLQRSL